MIAPNLVKNLFLGRPFFSSHPVETTTRCIKMLDDINAPAKVEKVSLHKFNNRLPNAIFNVSFNGSGRSEKLVVLVYIQSSKNVGGAIRVYYY